MSYRDKVNRMKEGGLYKVADFQVNGNPEQVREYTHEIAFFVEDVPKFEREIDILHFTDTGKQLAVNATNGDILLDAFGEPENWPGQRITLFLAPYGKEGKLGIRVRKVGAAAPTNAPLPTPISQPPFDDEVPFSAGDES
jgi:hypothetical protein